MSTRTEGQTLRHIGGDLRAAVSEISVYLFLSIPPSVSSVDLRVRFVSIQGSNSIVSTAKSVYTTYTVQKRPQPVNGGLGERRGVELLLPQRWKLHEGGSSRAASASASSARERPPQTKAWCDELLLPSSFTASQTNTGISPLTARPIRLFLLSKSDFR